MGLGDDFLEIFYSSCELIAEFPLQNTKVHNDFRRYLIRKFPYAIYYLIFNQQVVIFGLFHHSQNPKAIENQLNGRKK